MTDMPGEENAIMAGWVQFALYLSEVVLLDPKCAQRNDTDQNHYQEDEGEYGEIESSFYLVVDQLSLPVLENLVLVARDHL